jgi:hypothetical protein
MTRDTFCLLKEEGEGALIVLKIDYINYNTQKPLEL